ncbi:unnamed protein product [Trypanosoma congolense IL3000]|uniref:WGS project CAEQ00000000 data, annotated contig 722 n=1 Tax=Trypanosoma congolense (strain IL3000) TaxID=1068625 RepID=F9WI24_TRYCI|nr:unnamed protein product [Trypanosoma congolense IL3000]
MIILPILSFITVRMCHTPLHNNTKQQLPSGAASKRVPTTEFRLSCVGSFNYFITLRDHIPTFISKSTVCVKFLTCFFHNLTPTIIFPYASHIIALSKHKSGCVLGKIILSCWFSNAGIWGSYASGLILVSFLVFVVLFSMWFLLTVRTNFKVASIITKDI